MRVGIFTGEVVAGCLGSAKRLKFTTIGDTVNTASRLESYDKELAAPDQDQNPCRVLIGEQTRSLLGQRYWTEQVGDLVLKGKKDLIPVFRVFGRAEDRIVDA